VVEEQAQRGVGGELMPLLTLGHPGGFLSFSIKVSPGSLSWLIASILAREEKVISP
jgi:hypothetical protein